MYRELNIDTALDTDSDDDESMDDFDPSFILLAIDTHPSMFVKMNDNELTAFEMCFRACYQIADSLLVRKYPRNYSPFGVILANTEDDNKSALIDFKTNMIDIVKMLKKINATKLDELIASYQRKDLKSFDLSGFFLSCKKKFRGVKSNSADKVIIYFTNDDNPIGDDKNRRFTALNEAKNFEPNNIEFEVVTMNKDFNYSLFYNELFSLISPSSSSSSSSNKDDKKGIIEQLIEDEYGMNEKMANSIVLRYYRRKLQFYLDKNDIKRFVNIIQRKYISSSKLDNNYYTTNTGRPVKKMTVSEEDDEQYTLDYEHGNVEFTLAEYRKLNATDLPLGYTLVYVTKRITYFGYVIGTTAVLESDPKEDLSYFFDFWKYCVDENAVLVCARKLRKSDRIRFVELIPKCTNNKPTFLVKLIQYADEFEYPPGHLASKQPPKYSEEQFRVIEDINQAAMGEFNPQMFPSVSYAKKERYLKAKLLDEDENDQVIHDVVIDKEAIKVRLGGITERYKALFHKGQSKRKRETEQKGETGPKRRSEHKRQEGRKRKHETSPEQQPAAEAQSGPDAEPQSGPDAEPQSGSDVEPQSGPDVEPQSGPDAEPQSGPDVEPQSGPDVEPQSGPDVKPESNPELGPQLDPEPEDEPIPMPRKKTKRRVWDVCVV